MEPESGTLRKIDDLSESLFLSIVVPLYNEEDIVPELIERLLAVGRSLEIDFEIIAVNDGSSDGTLPLLIDLSRSHPELRVINLARNFGHMSALSAGVDMAKGDPVVVMDGDLQDPPELISQMMEKWRDGADVVLAVRKSRKESLLQRVGSAGFYWLMDKVAETPMPRHVGTFGLMNRWVAEQVAGMPERCRFFAGLRAWVGGRVEQVEYDRPDRPKGDSRVGLGGLVRLARTAIISFSTFPLRLASVIALLSALALFLVGATAIVVRIVTDLAIPGWATYTTLIGMMGFVQSLLLAVLSEYIAVIFDEIKGRPVFLIREEFSSGKRRVIDKGEFQEKTPRR